MLAFRGKANHQNCKTRIFCWKSILAKANNSILWIFKQSDIYFYLQISLFERIRSNKKFVSPMFVVANNISILSECLCLQFKNAYLIRSDQINLSDRILKASSIRLNNTQILFFLFRVDTNCFRKQIA